MNMNSNETRTKEGGSVASFIVVGLVLVGLVVGGLYAVNQRGEGTPTSPPVVSTNPTDSPATVTPSSPSAQSTSPTTPSTKPTAPPPTQKTPSAPSIGKGAPLPETGPGDYMPGGFLLAVLVAASISYARSRHDLRVATSAVD